MNFFLPLDMNILQTKILIQNLKIEIDFLLT